MEVTRMDETQNKRNRYRDRIETFGTDADEYVEIYDPLNEEAWIRASTPVPVED